MSTPKATAADAANDYDNLSDKYDSEEESYTVTEEILEEILSSRKLMMKKMMGLLLLAQTRTDMAVLATSQAFTFYQFRRCQMCHA